DGRIQFPHPPWADRTACGACENVRTRTSRPKAAPGPDVKLSSDPSWRAEICLRNARAVSLQICVSGDPSGFRANATSQPGSNFYPVPAPAFGAVKRFVGRLDDFFRL